MSLNVENPYPSVELLVKPLFEKLTFLSKVSSRKPGYSSRSKTRDAILLAITQALSETNEACNALCCESPDLSIAVGTAVDDISNTGQIFHERVQSFTDDPTNQKICDNLHESGTAFLSSLTRLLILADLSEKSHLNRLVDTILDNIEDVLSSTTAKQLSRSGERFRANTARLTNLLNKDDSDFQQMDLLEHSATLQYVFRHNNRLLLTAAKAYLNHPEVTATLALRDNVAGTICDALQEFRSTLDSSKKVQNLAPKSSKKLLSIINDFENYLLLGHKDLQDGRSSPSFCKSLQNQMEDLILAAYEIADSPDTEQEQRAAICEKCDHLRRAITQMADDPHTAAPDTAYCNAPSTEYTQVDGTVQNILKITGGLKDQLQRTAVGHAVQVLVANEQPLMSLCDATTFGDHEMMKSSVERFQCYSRSLINAVHELISLSLNDEISKSSLLACSHLERLTPQVVKAGEILFESPKSKSIESNYEAFKTAYQETSALLHTALKELISVHDLLAVADAHMKKDFDRSLQAIAERNDAALQNLATTMQQRASMVGSTVSAKTGPMFASQDYVEHVMNRVILLKNEHTPNFVNVSRNSVSLLAAQQPFNAATYHEAGYTLCDSLHNLRMAVLRETALPSEVESLKTQGSSSTLADAVEGGAFPDRAIESGSSRRTSVSGEQRMGRESTSSRTSTNATTSTASANKRYLPQETVASGYRASRTDETRSASSSPTAVSQQESQHYANDVDPAVLPEPVQENMHQELAGFLHEKNQFMKEMNKWDESNNDLVVLAKKMCLIMIEMTDYTRGKGPLTSTAQVIKAAREICDLGRRLDNLSGLVTDACPDSLCRRDLQAYRQRINLHCQQLDITCRVKAGLSATPTEEIENATALIQAARNLMNAVVLTVKESFLVSTKYPSTDHGHAVVNWKMRAPSKKPLFTKDSDSTLVADDGSDDRYRLREVEKFSQDSRQPNRSTVGEKNRNSSLYRSRRPRHYDDLAELSDSTTQ